MGQQPDFTSKSLNLSLANKKDICSIAHALSSELRLNILEILGRNSKNINELSRELDVPVSTIALSVQILIDSGILFAESQPGKRGQMKICARRIDTVNINLVNIQENQPFSNEIELPIGGYSLAGNIKPTCGMASESGLIGEANDMPMFFYHPDRFSAQILWMREGYVEYNFPKMCIQESNLEYLEFSFEACSEAPGHRNHWPSDIYVMVNGIELGVWHCPGDFGGRRGRLNPDWWNDISSQYGMLKTWKIDALGSWLDGDYLSPVTLKNIMIDNYDSISVQIGVKPNAKIPGGMNLFGKKFGDHPQGIVMRYRLK